MIAREDNFQPYRLETTWARVRHVLALPPQKLLIPAIVMGLIVAIWLGSVWVIPAIICGIILQYFIEYLIHRFLYHMRPPEVVNGRFKWLYSSHWGHHDFPNNPNLWGGTSRWFVPTVSLVFVGLIWALLTAFGSQQALPFALVTVYLGAIPTYLTYEWAHVTAHAAGKKNALERYITREHASHHFQNFNTNFHVNAGGILVDKVFGTAFDKANYTRPDYIRTMGLPPDDPRLIALRAFFADDYGISSSDQVKAQKL